MLKHYCKKKIKKVKRLWKNYSLRMNTKKIVNYLYAKAKDWHRCPKKLFII